MRRIGIYLRVSTEEQVRIQDGSLVSQKQRLLEFVESHNRREKNWGEVLEVYCDEGRSAKDMNRPEFQRLLTDVKLGRINLILATELSRLSRSIRDFCELWDLFKQHKTSFITLREQFDTTSAAGELMVFNLINFSQFERKQTAERILANFEARARRGLWNGGPVPFGFDKNPKNKGELIPHSVESKQLQEIFKLFLEVGSVRRTCLEIRNRGIMTKHFVNKHGVEKLPRQFTLASLQRLLTNPAYIGVRVYGNIGKVYSEVIKASWEPLIDEETYQKVQEKLQANKNRYKPDEWKSYPFPLTEIIICGECGKKIGGKSATSQNGTKHFYYEHNRKLNVDGSKHLQRCRIERVKAEKIEGIVLKSLKNFSQDEKLLDHCLDIYTRGTVSELPEVKGQLLKIKRDLETYEKRNKNLIERLSDLPQDVPADGIYAQIKQNKNRIEELERKYVEIQCQERKLSTLSVDREGLLVKVKRSIQNLDKAPIEKRRGIYANLIKFAEIHPLKVKIGIYAPVVTSSTSVLSGGTSRT